MAIEQQQTLNTKEATIDKKRILVVDDEPGIRLALSHLIEDSRPDYEVRTAESAEQALHMIEEVPFEVMITDYRLPSMDGLTLAKCANETSPKTWSILMTAYGSEQTHGDAFSEGCIAYVNKPFEVEQILSWIDRAMNRNDERVIPSNTYGYSPVNGNMLNAFSMVAEINSKPWYTPLPNKKKEKHPSAIQTICRSILNTIRDDKEE